MTEVKARKYPDSHYRRLIVEDTRVAPEIRIAAKARGMCVHAGDHAADVQIIGRRPHPERPRDWTRFWVLVRLERED